MTMVDQIKKRTDTIASIRFLHSNSIVKHLFDNQAIDIE
jgi:hypothetical protein